MAQDYDKIFREVLKDIFPAVARKTGAFGRTEKLEHYHIEIS
jgi:hypothetical protein